MSEIARERKRREEQDGKESGTGITQDLLRTTLVALRHVTAGVKERPIRVALLYYFVHLADSSSRNFSNRGERKTNAGRLELPFQTPCILQDLW